jgi:hypothetical protein
MFLLFSSGEIEVPAEWPVWRERSVARFFPAWTQTVRRAL